MNTLYTVGAAVVAVLAFLAWFAGKIAKMTRDAAAAKQKGQNDALQQKFDQIDAGAPDLDASIGRLRDRADNGGKPNPS
ncbi:hypothetical protein EOA32_00995 [Mesorhizobium sp. M1A.F.Ca.ET.072.01.1.1]|uniref:hypothetical protein n=1 Tax=Mesorhizobium sp. M1A.F.Ca.ET.072.01.1.1 TaxID=2496753 RepID=UPI000FD55726|nr:hypothetical protein [Mesorhizobium sp. M1A.F.Ca.ET.072.01.1.1]RUW55626.1 hypothetical protein EOA32_00995 [Mesorhizobium sp. M1A.F.Ca.ET.072.01.1.1]